MIIAAVAIVAFLMGLFAGISVTINVMAAGFKEGRWTREQMAGLLRAWRGPNGERW